MRYYIKITMNYSRKTSFLDSVSTCTVCGNMWELDEICTNWPKPLIYKDFGHGVLFYLFVFYYLLT